MSDHVMETTALAADIRALADIIQKYPEHYDSWKWMFRDLSDMAFSRDQLVQFTRDMSRELTRTPTDVGRGVVKEYQERWIAVFGYVGGIRVSMQSERSTVCEKVVIGTREVEKPDPNAPKVMVTEDVVEWRCSEPLLAEG